VIYSNGAPRRGTQADFQVLKDAGIELEGKMAMANYGGIYRGTKVKNAQDNGMAGCIIFTDPMDDGEVTEENGYEAYPSKHLCYHEIINV
jgi:N-acetylated-alpha-linked acidic dipeptidase